jgi:hypothetical protein
MDWKRLWRMALTVHRGDGTARRPSLMVMGCYFGRPRLGLSDRLPGRQQHHRAEDRADDADRPQGRPVPADQADQHAPDERPGQADSQQLRPVDRLPAGSEQICDPTREHAPHEDEQQDHRAAPRRDKAAVSG